MSTAPIYRIVSVEWAEADVSVIQFWWSIRKEPPYLVGEGGKDWEGPFSDYDEAVTACMKHFGLEGEVTFEEHDRTELQEERQFWPVYSGVVALQFSIALDEFSERASLAARETPERKELQKSLKVSAAIKNALADTDVLVLGCSPARLGTKPKLRRDKGMVTFEALVNIRFRSRLNLSSTELLERLTVSASLEELYPDVRSVVHPRSP